MLKQSLLLLLISIIYTGAYAQSDDDSSLIFDLENCFSNSGSAGSASDYSEFTAIVENTSECATLGVEGNNLYRLNPTENMHSCTPGIDDGIAMCVGIDLGCDYDAGSDKSIRFDITLEPSENMTATLTELRFFENAPESFDWINGGEGENNYPTLYGIRVLIDSEVIYEQSGIPTEQSWNQEIFTFADIPEFIVSESTVFNFELLPYCAIGNGAFVAAWDIDNVEVFAGCDPVNGGTITTTNGETELTICSGDGIDDSVQTVLTGQMGQNFQWVITDADGVILDLPAGPPFNFEEAGEGVCVIWHLAFADGLVGAEVGLNAADLMGSYDLSNPITVTRDGVAGGELSLEGGATEIEICAGDGIADPLNVELTGNIGDNSAWVITDTDGNILGLPTAPPFDLDEAGDGTCLIWNLSFVDGLLGAAVGLNANDLEGCFDLSNPVTVVRNQPTGGSLTFQDGSEATSICALDGDADPLDVELAGAVGANMAWVITDTDGVILDLPLAPPFDFEEAGEGTCLIWSLSFFDGLTGAEIGMNANDLTGCFELSNPLTVVRNIAQGGELAFEGGETEMIICAGDDIADPLNVELTGSIGDNMTWVITDGGGIILDLASSPPFDLDGAGEGTCLIWHLAFADGLTGAEVGLSAGDLGGCFDLSNPLTVIRNVADGGEITFDDETTEAEICLGDGNTTPLDVVLTGETGESSAWVITDTDGIILDLPAEPPFNFEEAGPGTCLIWHVGYSGALDGAEVGLNANDLMGCHDLSNPLTVIREEVQGGELATIDGETQLTICADDGESDAFDVELTGTIGEFNQWVITDGSGIILGLPMAPPFDLEGAGGGVCFVWNLSYNGVIDGLELMSNTNNLEGCYELSNPITVTRLIGDNCEIVLCEAEGGELSLADGTLNTTICVGDGIADPIDVILTGESGPNSLYVVTDTDANILDLSSVPPIDLDNFAAGTCLVWHLAFEDGLEGAEIGNNVTDLDGCFDLSNAITVEKVTGDDCDGLNCDVDGGDLTFEDGSFAVEICVGDSIPDLLNVILEGEMGTNSAWVVTNVSGLILDLPTGPPFDFEDVDEGICLIWHLSFEDGLVGAEIGLNANDLEGCFDLSNPISVTRLSGPACDNIGCNVDGGFLTTTDGEMSIEICAGDGIADPIDVILSDAVGDSMTWLITDANGTILELPVAPPFDLEGAGPGLCLIWNLSSTDEITGLEVGMNANNIGGCTDLSNQISVQRYEGDDCLLIGCEAEGGSLTFADSTVTTTICVGEGIDDLLDVELTGEMGENSQWVITDASGLILELPIAPPFNLEGAGSGICLIWNLTYDGMITGAEVGMNANDIVGCYDLSNSISVVRVSGDECDQIGCEAQGGNLALDDGETNIIICAGDGIPDPLDVELTNASGDSMFWVITDPTGMIIALPTAPPFDLDDAGEGVCLIWNVSTIGEITGADLGLNANDIEGCHDLSNPIVVERVTGSDCDELFCTVEGGALTFEDGTVEVTICVGDGLPDPLLVNLVDNVGDSMQWVITDDMGMILELPGAPPFDLDGAGEGVCQIWNLAFDGSLEGLETGMNTANLDGCFSLSNPLTVVRVSGDDCDGGLTPEDPINLSVYPNPTAEMLYIELKELPTSKAEVTIFNQAGRNMSSTTGTEGKIIKLNVEEYSSGIYFVRTISGDSVKIMRMVKIK